MELKCSNNSLKTLPNLPLTLMTLECNANLLARIPELPESLSVFSCNDNPLIEPFKTFYAVYDASMDVAHLRASIHEYYQANPVNQANQANPVNQANENAIGIYVPDQPAYPIDADKERIDYYYKYLTELTELQQYTISQYSFHGDVILNTMLRGRDDIDTYKNNIASPWTAVRKYPLMQLSCLYLYLLEPLLAENEYLKAKSPGVRRISYYQLDSHVKPPLKTLNRWNDQYRRNNGRRNLPIADFTAFKKEMLEIYSTRTYPQLRDRLLAFDLDYFRRLTYDAFKVIFNAIQATVPSLPPSLKRGNGFITYRGVKKFYLPTTKQPILMNTFTSTTAMHDAVYNFYMGESTGGIYQFIVAPNTPCLYIESITYVPDEYEYLFPPGVRFVYISNYKNDRAVSVQVFLVLPPLPDSPVGTRVPDRYEDYMQWVNTLEWTGQAYTPPTNSPTGILQVSETISLLVDIIKYMAPDSEPTPEELAALSARVPYLAPVHAEALGMLPIPTVSENNLYAGGGGARVSGMLKRRTRRTRRTRRAQQMRGGRTAIMKPVQSRFNSNGITRKLNKGKKLMGAPPPRERNTKQKVVTRPVPMDNKVNTTNTASTNVGARIKGDRWDTSQPVQYAVSKFTAKEAAYMKLIEKIIEKNTRN